MTISCADLRCKYRNDKGKCTCKKVELSAWSVNTLNMGRKDFLECKSFEYDSHYLDLCNLVMEYGLVDSKDIIEMLQKDHEPFDGELR